MINITEMTSSITKSGLVYTNLFDIQITSPSSIDGDKESITMRTSNGSIPGRTFLSTNYRENNLGPVRKIPYGSSYGDYTIGVILSEDQKERLYFEKWMNSIVDTSFENPNDEFKKVKYREKYEGTVIVNTRDINNGKVLTSFKLLDAYPVGLGEIALDWSSNAYATLQVTFAYRYYTMEAKLKETKIVKTDEFTPPDEAKIKAKSKKKRKKYDDVSFSEDTLIHNAEVISDEFGDSTLFTEKSIPVLSKDALRKEAIDKGIFSNKGKENNPVAVISQIASVTGFLRNR